MRKNKERAGYLSGASAITASPSTVTSAPATTLALVQPWPSSPS